MIIRLRQPFRVLSFNEQETFDSRRALKHALDLIQAELDQTKDENAVDELLALRASIHNIFTALH